MDSIHLCGALFTLSHTHMPAGCWQPPAACGRQGEDPLPPNLHWQPCRSVELSPGGVPAAEFRTGTRRSGTLKEYRTVSGVGQVGSGWPAKPRLAACAPLVGADACAANCYLSPDCYRRKLLHNRTVTLYNYVRYSLLESCGAAKKCLPTATCASPSLRCLEIAAAACPLPPRPQPYKHLRNRHQRANREATESAAKVHAGRTTWPEIEPRARFIGQRPSSNAGRISNRQATSEVRVQQR